jgi:hypothetical protein
MRTRTLLVLAIAACGGDSNGPQFVSHAPCDAGIALADNDPLQAAKAIGICDGLVSATWVYPNGNPDTGATNFAIGRGILSAFGANNAPTEGTALLALSSGAARAPANPGYAAEFDKGYPTAVPTGFPHSSAGCPAPEQFGRDGIGLEVVLEVPAGVTAFAFDHAFFSRDYPVFVCTTFVDQAGALVTGATGLPALSNVLLDASGNPMYPSPTSLTSCQAQQDTAGAENYMCPMGTTALTGTGFEGHGGMAWVRISNRAVSAGDTVRIRFMIWDTSDGISDTSMLIDGFAWIP